ncbi:MAG TPA: glucosyl-3-phosphoglycerate synthase [Gaiellaceae bacterium]|nr:glucosyl-3-phosphoglycerate synthase [Gaiellaceae bacterium]
MAADPSIDVLVQAKAALGTTVSVCLPARNEESTVGQIVATVRRTLVHAAPLVDEVVVMDDGSTDATAAAAAYDGARVVSVGQVLPELPAGSGKGNALWLSLYACEGDIVCWVDADIRNFAPHFVTRLLAPLLTDPSIGFVKGFYRRPLYDKVTGGGRVTELLARPVISALFPHLAAFVQPLSGEYAGRRELLESVPFIEGYGVEIGLLIDLVARFGTDAMAQADLGVREHRNRPLEELGPQAMAVLVTGLRRAGIPVDRRLAELVRYDMHQDQERVPVEIRERPSMLSIPEYRAKFGRAVDTDVAVRSLGSVRR